jgi:hypothetical protein
MILRHRQELGRVGPDREVVIRVASPGGVGAIRDSLPDGGFGDSAAGVAVQDGRDVRDWKRSAEIERRDVPAASDAWR